ncbi:MAG: nucleoside-diphosphate sugar epimerase/dehydratase [Candidatus Sulfotelmatobacter sp.]
MRKPSFDPYSALNQKLIDSLVAGTSFYLAYQAVFEGRVPNASAFQMWTLLPVVMLGHVLINTLLRTYRMIWRYLGLLDALILARNCALIPAALLALHFVPSPALLMLRVPVGVIAVEYLLFVSGGLAARIVRRLLYEGVTARALNGRKATPVLLIGAGRAGIITANEMRTRVDLRPVAFLDDDPKKKNTVIAGLRTLGAVSLLGEVIREYRVQQVIICIARPPRFMQRHIWATCEAMGVTVKMVPTLEEILGDRFSIASFRNIEMKDLLSRNPIEGSASDAELRQIYGGKCILVTGSGGSIGSELALQLSQLDPSRLLLLDKDENGLNDTYLHLQKRGCEKCVPLVADLRFTERLRHVFETFHPEVVFHAAAHKHVHLMEINPCEAIANNVTGTRNLAEQAVAFGVAWYIQVSTDKAVNPTCVMGASKRVGEMIVQAQGDRHLTRFCCVRFGNVLGSRGSVVPIFQQQILEGGPVTVTHADAQRFLMTIPEAVCLLIQAGTLAHTGEIFVLDMGDPVLIQTLARDLIELSGLRPDKDVRIEITQMKPGEKLTEVLVDGATEKLRPTALDKIQAISTQPLDPTEFAHKLRALEGAARQGDTEKVYQSLAAMNIGFVYRDAPLPWPSRVRHPASSDRVRVSMSPPLEV